MATTGRKLDTEIASHTLGHRTLAGTDWPIENVVTQRRHSLTYKVIGYRVTFGLCNGIPTHAQDYRSRREAFAAAGITD